MRLITEQQTAELVTPEIAFAAAREALIAAAGPGVLFPAVIAHGSDPKNRFSIKSGVIDGAAGLKVGSLWPDNAIHGLPRHSSIILLFDENTGRIDTIIEASAANALRTAAADAVAAAALARQGARTLAVFGTGHQAFHEVIALSGVRLIETVLIVGRSATSARSLAERLASRGIATEVTDARSACLAADIIVTATPARGPLFPADWIRPGTHIAAMGADGPGKQELPPELFDHAALFCDSPRQSIALGEFQSVAAKVSAGEVELTALGSVLLGEHPGRVSEAQITIFDSSGIALQDLALARHVLHRIGSPSTKHE